MKKKRKLPSFPEDVNRIGRSFVTKNQIRKAILKDFPVLVEEYCIFRRFDPVSGLIKKKYAWHSIIELLNKDGKSEEIITKLLWTSKHEEQN